MLILMASDDGDADADAAADMFGGKRYVSVYVCVYVCVYAIRRLLVHSLSLALNLCGACTRTTKASSYTRDAAHRQRISHASHVTIAACITCHN